MNIGNKRLIDILRCTRPVLFDNELENYRYSMRGTGFICRVDSKDLFVTARHVIDGFPLESVCVPYYYGSREFVPYSTRMKVLTADQFDTDWSDIAVLALDEGKYGDNAFREEGPFVLAEDTIERSFDPGKHLVLRGFPSSTNNIDYEASSITLAGTSFGARIVGPSPMDHCIEISFNDLSGCDTLDGISGSAVFSLDKIDPPYKVNFAGMMLRGTKMSGIGHMLSGETVLKILTAAIAA